MENRVINLGVIGYGCRSYGMTDIFLGFDDVRVVAVCDKYEDRVEAGKKFVSEKLGYTPLGTTNYHDVLENSEVEAVLISCDWEMHLPIAIDAIKANKAVALEVGGAYSLQECFDVVEEWEKNPVPFMFLENCCYGRREMMALNMVKRGLFGEIIHCDAYTGGFNLQIAFSTARLAAQSAVWRE